MNENRTVTDFSGVAIGTATEADEFYDFAGVRCGRVTAQGEAFDHAGVHIGRCRSQAGREATSLAGAGTAGA